MIFKETKAFLWTLKSMVGCACNAQWESHSGYRKGRRVGLEELWTSGKLGPHPDFWTVSFRSPDQSLHLSRPLSPQLLEGCNSTVSRLSTGLPQWLSSGESTCNKAEDLGSVPESGRPLGGGHSKPIQSSCLINLMNRGAWWAP